MLEVDIHLFHAIYEILHGVTAVGSLFGGFSSNVCAAKVSKTTLFIRRFNVLINMLTLLNLAATYYIDLYLVLQPVVKRVSYYVFSWVVLLLSLFKCM